MAEATNGRKPYNEIKYLFHFWLFDDCVKGAIGSISNIEPIGGLLSTLYGYA